MTNAATKRPITVALVYAVVWAPALWVLMCAPARAAFQPRSLDAPWFTPASRTPHPAVCRVLVDERGSQAAGSGTLVDSRDRYGLVITNWHVVRDATGTIEVVFPGGFRSEARVLKLDETWDLAALAVWRPPTAPVPLAEHPPRPGDPLTICGYGGGDYRAATGRCTDFYAPEVGLPTELVELDVEARQGDSGGPILNHRGEIAGVLFGASGGTTLGSFGPRVRSFLATLAPDVGAPTSVRSSKWSGLGQPTESNYQVVDPFLLAERQGATAPTYPQTAHPNPVDPARAARPAYPTTHARDVARTGDRALTDRSHAPRLASAKPRGGGWLPPPSRIGDEPSAGWRSSPRPTFDSAHASSGVASAVTTASPIADDPLAGIDLVGEGRTLLAVIGAAAIAVAVARAGG